MRLLEMLPENAHLPFDKLTALSKVEGLRYPHPSSLRRTSLYASFLGISEALHLDIFHQPLRSWFFDSLKVTDPLLNLRNIPLIMPFFVHRFLVFSHLIIGHT
jgi:hypothetical protein